MADFKKGFMTTLGVITAMSVWVTVSNLFKADEEPAEEAEQKTE